MVMVSMIVVMLVLATQVVVSVTRVQDFHLDEVEDKTHDSYNEHDISLNLRRLPEALGRFPEEPSCHNPDS